MANVFVGLITMVVGLMIGVGIGFLFRPMLDSYLRWKMATDGDSHPVPHRSMKEHDARRN